MIGCSAVRSVEKRFFQSLNRVVEPSIRLGIGSPWLAPVGIVMMETRGRKSGKRYNIPVLASEFQGMLVAGTVRGRSQWLKNVAAVPEISVWLRGKRRACTAYVIADGELSQPLPADASAAMHWLADGLKPLSRRSNAGFVILALASQAEAGIREAATVHV